MLVLDDDDLCNAVRSLNVDPTQRGRYPLYNVLRRNVRALHHLEHPRHPLRFAYSVKTNPDPQLLEFVRDAGLYAEVISPQELELALSLGFDNRTIYNGPQPAWRAGTAPGIVFSDSVESFVENAKHLEGALIGIRIRPPGIRSRFGLEESMLPAFYDAVRSLDRRTIGVSMHVRPEDFNGRSWRDVVAVTMEIARTIERHCGVRVTAFDVGGGNTPLEFDRSVARGDFAWLIRETCAAFPYSYAVFAEPGQAVATPGAIFVAPVLEVRREGGRTDVVVDAGYPDLPQITTFPHRILGTNGVMVRSGNDRILGCTCLEYDIIRDDVALPSAMIEELRAVVIADVGAYDASMGFDFARGGNNVVNERSGVTAG